MPSRRRPAWPSSRRGTLPLDVLERVDNEPGPAIERVDPFNDGEPFRYRYGERTQPARTCLLETLQHCRSGRELMDCGRLQDLSLASELDASIPVPRFDGTALVAPY